MQCNMKERMEWVDHINRGDFDHKNVLVLDECSVGTNTSRRVRGYGPVGHRVRHYDLFGKTHNGTLMTVCNSDGSFSLHVAHLNISCNQIGPAGAERLAGVIRQCASLTHLDLSENDIGDAGIASIAGVLTQ